MSPHELFQQALQAYQKHDFTNATQLCQKALKKQPNNSDSLHLMAILTLNEAGAYQQEADQQFEVKPQTQQNQAYQQAVHFAKKAVKHAPHNANFLTT
jgi:thioredoxin-like negative regulator of GroEL